MAFNFKKAIETTAKTINKGVGGEDLAEYLGTAIARSRAPEEQKQYIKTDVTREQALRSAALVGASMASIASWGQFSAASVAAKARPIPVPTKISVGGKTVPVHNPFNATYRPAVPKPKQPMKITNYQ